MGLEVKVFDEFWPITPVRTTTHAIAVSRKGLISSQQQQQNEEGEEDCDCHTPTSPSRRLTIPLECPPAPKKPRRAVAVSVAIAPPPPPPSPSHQSFFQVPRDLASVFFPPSSNNIKATS